MTSELSPTGGSADPRPSPGLRASHADRDRVVEILRVAAGDGRLTPAELDERIEMALSARTAGELAGLTADLVTGQARDLIQIRQYFGFLTRNGQWEVPRRMRMRLFAARTKLDFTSAVITHDVLRIELDQSGGFLTLIIKPGIVVDPSDLAASQGNVRIRAGADPDVPVSLRVELVGRVRRGHVFVHCARR
jgi:Domain of unknown function (DUF1707)